MATKVPMIKVPAELKECTEYCRYCMSTKLETIVVVVVVILWLNVPSTAKFI